MYSSFSGEIARLRQQEMLAAARQHIELEQHRRAAEQEDSVREPRRVRSFLYRRALQVAGLSVFLLLIASSVALASPAGPGTRVDGSAPLHRVPAVLTGVQQGSEFTLVLVVSLILTAISLAVAVRRNNRLLHA